LAPRGGTENEDWRPEAERRMKVKTRKEGEGAEAAAGSNRDCQRLNLDRQRPAADKEKG
jgi:hypothetical protein